MRGAGVGETDDARQSLIEVVQLSVTRISDLPDTRVRDQHVCGFGHLDPHEQERRAGEAAFARLFAAMLADEEFMKA